MDLDSNTKKMLDEQRDNCIFCSISSGRVPSQKIFENDRVFAILDINPASVGHVLVMTKEHYPILPLIPLNELTYVCESIKSIGESFLKKLGVAGYTIFIANGAAAGQKAPHFVLHLIPRKFEDNLDFSVRGRMILNSNDTDSLAASFAPSISANMNYTSHVASSDYEKKSDKPANPLNNDASDDSDDVDLDDISGLFGG